MANNPSPKGLLNAQTGEFRAQYLPPNFDQDPVSSGQLDTLIATLVKAEKTTLANLLRTGLCCADVMEAVPHLGKLVANVYSTMDPKYKNETEIKINQDAAITAGAKVRLAYLRYMFNQHRLRQLQNPEQKPPPVWEMIDADLQVLRRKAPMYQFAFSQLLYEYDHRLWNGLKTIDDEPDNVQSLPSEEEIEARVKLYTTNPSAHEAAKNGTI